LWAKRLTASTIFAAGRSKATDRLDASLGNFLRLQLNDSDFEHARQVARRVEVDDADAAWGYVGKRL
jgi:hypothetical protein